MTAKAPRTIQLNYDQTDKILQRNTYTTPKLTHMTSGTSIQNQQLAPREIYSAVNSNFDLLTSSYKIELSPSSRQHLSILIQSIDLVDNYLDQMELQSDRELFSDALIAFINNKNELQFQIPEQIEIILNQLKASIKSTNVSEPFASALKTLLYHTEAKRHVDHRSDLFMHIQKEGIATADMPLLFIREEISKDFKEMFLMMCQSMGMADLLIDARDDFRNRLIQIRPDVVFYSSITMFLLRKGCRIFWKFPKKRNLLLYLYKMIHLLVT